ncbi:MAG: protein phosphatase 2C domain-containing protein [Verrucomicrobiae bacterium]|nr:protein phosphatase 2C domain-containing protein [Verrucomicrobiae bacterium]
MKIAKDGIRSIVRVGYDGRVYKTFRGTDSDKRFANEIKVLQVLEDRGCDFVPRLLDSDESTLTIVTTNCGAVVQSLSEEKTKSIFDELKDKFGVIHDDPFVRNITYHAGLGRFCVIDFELATIIERDGDTAGGLRLRVEWTGISRDGYRKPGNDDAFAVFSSEQGWAHEQGASGGANLRDVGLVMAVSDGMGGVKGGNVASRLAVSELRRFLPALLGDLRKSADPLAVLAKAVRDLHDYIKRRGSINPDLSGMGATLVCGLFYGTEMHFAHVGDSRLYRWRAGELEQMTYDHSRVGIQFRKGEITELQARMHPRRNVLTQVIGADCQYVRPQTGTHSLKEGDWYLFCSDGVTDGLWNKNIRSAFDGASAQGKSTSEVAQAMLDKAVQTAGADDTTMIVVKVVREG